MGSLKKGGLPHFCLICGVDSGPIKTFLVIFMGSLVFAAAMIFVWAWLTKRVGTNESLSSFALDAEDRSEKPK